MISPIASRSSSRRSPSYARDPASSTGRPSLDHEDGPLVFLHACKLGLEGVLSKRRDSAYASGRSPHWIKSKNPNAPAVKREAEDWGQWPANALKRGLAHGHRQTEAVFTRS